MSYAALMVHVDVEGDLGPQVKVAGELAGLFDAHLIGIAGWAPMSVFLAEDALKDPMPPIPPLQDMKSALDERGRQFRAAVECSDRTVEWRSSLDFPADYIAREARAADLIIIGNGSKNRDPFRALDPGDLLLKAGRPVLVVPKGVGSFSIKRIAVAWKDVREARRAVFDALPLLKMAKSIMIIEVSEGDADPSWNRVKDVSSYLAQHHIENISERLQPCEIGTAQSLLRVVQSENIDLIVAGAYGHSRLGEWVFGGVTRGLLADTPVCCLLSH